MAVAYALLACGRTSQPHNASMSEGGVASDVPSVSAGAVGTHQDVEAVLERLRQAIDVASAAECTCVFGETMDSNYVDCVEGSVSEWPIPACLGVFAPHDTENDLCVAEVLEEQARCFVDQGTCEGGEQVGACRLPVWNRCGGLDGIGYCSRIHFCSPPFDDKLPRRDVCDGTADCPNGSDELNCVKGQDYFECDDGERIDLNRVCDQVADCADETDETRCHD